jgi:hypothetical protein
MTNIYTKGEVNGISTLTLFYNKTDTDTLLNAKQNNLTSATTLLGVGSSISALDYNKITINKPSVFPADMTNIKLMVYQH